jgi:hypothetical protein
MSDKLKEVLKKKFPEEEIGSLAKLLSIAARKGRISYEEIEAQEVTEDEILLTYHQRMLLPTRTSQVSKSLAWEDRILVLKLGEEYEMPFVIQQLIKRIEEIGGWEPEYAIKKYLEGIGELKVEEIIAFLQKVKDKSKTNKVTPEIMKKYSSEIDLEKTIVELKGGGIISPCLRNAFRYGLRYEINPSLY